jgi:hypothetical protein
VDAARWEILAQICAYSSWSRQLKDLGRTLEEHETLLYLHETNLEVREAMLAEELERRLCPFNRQNILVELDKARE